MRADIATPKWTHFLFAATPYSAVYLTRRAWVAFLDGSGARFLVDLRTKQVEWFDADATPEECQRIIEWAQNPIDGVVYVT